MCGGKICAEKLSSVFLRALHPSPRKTGPSKRIAHRGRYKQATMSKDVKFFNPAKKGLCRTLLAPRTFPPLVPPRFPPFFFFLLDGRDRTGERDPGRGRKRWRKEKRKWIRRRIERLTQETGKKKKKKGELHELKQDLDSGKPDKQKTALKSVIAAMTVGKDVSILFPDIVKCIQTPDLELKKLVYLYLMNYAKSQPDLAILAVNTFVTVSPLPSFPSASLELHWP